MKRIIRTLLMPLLLVGCLVVQVSAANVTVTAIPNSFGLQPWSSYYEGLCLYAKNSSIFGYIDANGKIAIPARFSVARDFSEGKAMVVVDNKVCYIDRTGKVVIKTPYTYNSEAYSWANDGETEFRNGIASVANDEGLWGAIDTTGRTVIPCKYQGPLYFDQDGLAQVGCNYVDRNGNLLWPKLDPTNSKYSYSVAVLGDGRLLAISDWREGGFMGSSFEVLAYDLLDSQGGLIRSGLSRAEGEKLKASLGYRYMGTPDTPWVIEEYGLDPNRYLSAELPSDGYILARLKYAVAQVENGGYTNVFVDAATGEEVLGPYEAAESFREGYAVVRPIGSNSYTIIDRTGKQCIPAQYDTGVCDGFREGRLLLVRENSLYLAKNTTATAFKDVAVDQYYYSPVRWAVAKQITNGTSSTTFSPNQTCTRAQIITFLWRAAGCPIADGPVSCIDVAPGAYYYDAVAWAFESGMVEGNTFSPNAPCSRLMAVDFLWKAAGEPDAGTAVPFADLQADQKAPVAWALRLGVTNGTSATAFSPDQTCTRGQIVTFLYRTLPTGDYYRTEYPTSIVD